MPNSCQNCGTPFEITNEDHAFYQKVQVPPPTLCPDCRLQRRLTRRNERSFHARNCGLCGKKIISVFSADNKFPIYCHDCWWGNQWDPLSYGRDFDFNRPFFEQFRELEQTVPQLYMINAFGENCDYSNYGYHNRNCYLLISSDDCEDCHFGDYVWNSKDCLDCLNVTDSQLCYQLVESGQCYHCLFSKSLENCTDCFFCYDLKGCQNCFGCAGLRRQSYCFFNQQLNKESYQAKIKELTFTPQTISEFINRLKEIVLKTPHKYANLVNCHNCTGDGVRNSKNSFICYDSYGLEDCKFVTNGPGKVKNCYDFYGAKNVELSYEGVSVGNPGFFNRFSLHVWEGSNNTTYCSSIITSENLFGAIGLRQKKYCILNKQYSQEEYEKLVPRIIAHMQKTGEWGEFFPIILSPFAYNESPVQEYFPLTKEEALAKGYKWKDEPVETLHCNVSTTDIPDNIQDVPDSITTQILTCTQCGKNYRIIPQELRFYRQMNLPVPHKCPDCRHQDRMKLRNPRKLWSRTCAKCGTQIETTYAPERPEIIYCEKCYLETVV